ncbi:uncharacterized protein ColSpa_06557 [Colletotrichum spaethianum]|uniref:Uncharacterized protein n=1 Tax=Colletotrichum spaethianum TaxID=700344 RepID=A0AA37LD04_9PEZI|nr:uncharacterized protein ColSpa_06557 [Colletotrichum spaethianum]GKT46376.1 hypothetical protein ColSpa_06557 [Colletotrichum spaethianum]
MAQVLESFCADSSGRRVLSPGPAHPGASTVNPARSEGTMSALLSRELGSCRCAIGRTATVTQQWDAKGLEPRPQHPMHFFGVVFVYDNFPSLLASQTSRSPCRPPPEDDLRDRLRAEPRGIPRTASLRRATDGPSRRQTRTNLRVDTLRKAANNTHRINSRGVEEAKSSGATNPSSRETRSSRKARNSHEPGLSKLNEPASEAKPVDDIYEFQASSPRKRKPEEETSSGYRKGRAYTSRDFDTGDGLFVVQEEDDADDGGDEQLYDDPTIVGLPPSAQTREEGQSTEDAVHDNEPQSSAATEQVRRLVVDMGPAPPEPSDEDDDGYPDDHLIFNPPAGQETIAAAPIKSNFLKSIAELMGGTGWTQSRGEITSAAHKAQFSKRTRPLWNELCHLNNFWEGMPRAPLFDQQCDYLHSDDEDATSARLSVRKVDGLIRALADKAKQPSHGEESDMPPLRFVVDIYERIIPLLVHILESVFRKGADLERSRYTGRFTKTTLQIMQRVAAWIEKLYEAMQVNLIRRRLKEQTLSKRISREKLGGYLRGFKSELEQAWRTADEVIECQQRYEQRLLLSKTRKDREQREFEEARRRQRELCDRRLEEYLRRTAVERAQIEASSSQYPSQRTSRGRQQATLARTEPVDRAEMANAGPSKPWPEDEAKRLLRVLSTRPQIEMEALVWEFERSEEDVKAMVELLKQSARTYAASRGRQIPAFAAS